jgi:hypothetical protein
LSSDNTSVSSELSSQPAKECDRDLQREPHATSPECLQEAPSINQSPAQLIGSKRSVGELLSDEHDGSVSPSPKRKCSYVAFLDKPFKNGLNLGLESDMIPETKSVIASKETRRERLDEDYQTRTARILVCSVGARQCCPLTVGRLLLCLRYGR